MVKLGLVGAVAGLGMGYLAFRSTDPKATTTQRAGTGHYHPYGLWGRSGFGGGSGVDSAHSGTVSHRGGFGSTGRSFFAGG